MIDPTDDALQAHFDRLRTGDAARSPSFRRVWDRAELRLRPSRRIPSPIAWAAAAGIVLTFGIWRYRSADDTRIPAGPAVLRATRAIAVDRFVSPTAMLLQTSRHALLAPPSILSSVLDGATGAPILPKGD